MKKACINFQNCRSTVRKLSPLFKFCPGLPKVKKTRTDINFWNAHEQNYNSCFILNTQAVSKMARSSIMKLNSLHRVIRQLRKLFEDAFGADNLFDSKSRLQKDFRIPRIHALRDEAIVEGGIDYFRYVVSG